MLEYYRNITGLLRQSKVKYVVEFKGKHKVVKFIGKNGRAYYHTVDLMRCSYRTKRNGEAYLRRQLKEAGLGD